MFTTAGIARCTAALYDTVVGALAAGGAAGAATLGMPAREGSHSGRNVEITNSTATATVVACAKVSQSRNMGGGCSIRKFPWKYKRLEQKSWTSPRPAATITRFASLLQQFHLHERARKTG